MSVDPEKGLHNGKSHGTTTGTGLDNPVFIDDDDIPKGSSDRLGPNMQLHNSSSPLFLVNNNSVKLKDQADDVNGVQATLPKAEQGTSSDERDQWGSQVEFLLSCISMSVGLGNVWRFPFVAYENGGGAFLIPYLIVLTVIGRPIYFLEMALGQFSAAGSIKVWKVAPFFKGVGYTSMFGTIVATSYYCSIMAITIFYFFASFRSVLPWADCQESWAGEGMCAENVTYQNAKGENISLAELYYNKFAFQQLQNVDDGIGAPEWRLTLCLLLSWILIFFSLVKGVKSSGKVAYFTALFPYVVLITLLIRGVTLPGAAKGMEYFITPNWSELYNPKVWYAATTQCFFSLGTGLGPIIMFSSYNPFRHNIYRDAMIISVTDTFTSLLSGLTTFAILGSLAEQIGVDDIGDVIKSGPGMTFISYPEAIAKFNVVPQLFSVLFFLMLLALGVGTAVSLTSTVITIICDQWPKLVRWQVTLVISVLGFFSGLIYVTPGGQFMLTLLDYHGANFVFYIAALCETIGIAWFYGLYNFEKDIEFMTGIKIGLYWIICWGFIIPVGLTVILVYAFATTEQLTHEGVAFPLVATVIGWTLSAVTFILLPGWALHAVLTRKSTTFREKFWESLRPTKEWGPQSPQLRAEWKEFKMTGMQKQCARDYDKFIKHYGFEEDKSTSTSSGSSTLDVSRF